MAEARPASGYRNWRLELALILLVAFAIRGTMFVGFGLVDDSCYVDSVDTILGGGYPPLDPLNQYAYRPLLLYLLAGGVAVFGHTDVGIVAPVFLASLVTTTLVYVFVRRLIDPAAAWWCGLLFALQPFNVVNSTTITNDVILACLVFASLSAFLTGDQDADRSRSRRFMIASGALMVAALLVKIAVFPALSAIAIYSVWTWWRGSAGAARRHAAFFLSFAAGLACICLVYYLKTGDPFWSFKSELLVYDVQQAVAPRAEIDYRRLLWEYPKSLFGISGYQSFGYFNHGLLLWLFVPACVWLMVRQRTVVVTFLTMCTMVVFLFFEFWPQHVVPQYVPVVRQDRYLEMLLPGVVIIVGTMLYRVSKIRPILAYVVLAAVLIHFVDQASRRSFHYVDSARDIRALASFAAETVAPAHKPLILDVPSRAALRFYLWDTPIDMVPIVPNQSLEIRDSYVVTGGARFSWWPWELVFNPTPEQVPADWRLEYEVPGQDRPWRLSPLRVYYVAGGTAEWPTKTDRPAAGTLVSEPGTPLRVSDTISEAGPCQPIFIESRRIEATP